MNKQELEDIWAKARQEIRSALIKMADRVWPPPVSPPLVSIVEVTVIEEPEVEKTTVASPPAKRKTRRTPAKKSVRKK